MAVDGPGITLPREPADHGFRVADGAHHPQGMASVLHRLRDRTPVDLHLSGHGNGRIAALTHLDHADGGDVIVHHRGYHSLPMALAHVERGLHLLFRIKAGADPTSGTFIAPDPADRTVTPGAPGEEAALRGRTLHVRLVRYTAGDTEHHIATSPPDSGRHRIQPPSDLYHGRWGIEGMYRSGKPVIEWFHARSPRGVRREPCAAFTLPTLTRRFPDRCDSDPTGGGGEEGLPAMRTNFRNGLRPVGRETGALFPPQAGAVRESVARIMAGLSRRIQRGRPGRSHIRESKRPRNRWARRRPA